jgi:hypothetical protein
LEEAVPESTFHNENPLARSLELLVAFANAMILSAASILTNIDTRRLFPDKEDKTVSRI